MALCRFSTNLSYASVYTVEHIAACLVVPVNMQSMKHYIEHGLLQILWRYIKRDTIIRRYPRNHYARKQRSI